MLSLRCPHCDVDVDETDLAPGGEAHIRREGPGASDEAFEAYLFERANPRGVVLERWRHAYGCGRWFHAARCSLTMEVFATYGPAEPAPPPAVVDAIRARRPEWSP